MVELNGQPIPNSVQLGVVVVTAIGVFLAGALVLFFGPLPTPRRVARLMAFGYVAPLTAALSVLYGVCDEWGLAAGAAVAGMALCYLCGRMEGGQSRSN